ncbi:acyl-CoA thioesterase [Thermodesulfobacteriota bacterium]
MNEFTTEYRVIYGDCDPFDVVYYGNYLDLFERGRTELFRELGMTYRQCQDLGIFTPVSETFCKYHKSARYDDVLLIATAIPWMKRVSIRFDYRIYRKETRELLAEGYTVHAFVDQDGKLRRAPSELAEVAQKMLEPAN